MWLNRIANRLPAILFGLFLGLTAGYAPISQAGDLAGAFGGLLNGASVHTTEAGSYQSQVRNSYVLGGTRIRFPRTSVQLFSITPPSFSAGCNGIDFMFGGFSFISGEQFAAMIRNIGQAALGHVVYLALKQLCPQCQAVIEALQKAAQMAQKSAMDSCQAGTALGNMVGDALGWDANKAGEKSTQVCGARSSERGESDSFLSAQSVMDGICGGIDKATKWLEDLAKSDPKEAKKLADTVGNRIWLSLMALGFDDDIAMAEIMMTMTGYSVYRTNADTGEAEAKTKAPAMNPDKLLDVFLCGTKMLAGAVPNPTGFPSGDAYCNAALDGQTLMIYECDNLDRCENPESKPISQWTRINDLGAYHGFLYYIHTQLTGAVEKVANNQALSVEDIQFIQHAPLPLYKAINLAAVYPNASKQLIENNTLMLGFLYADAYFRHLIEEIKKNSEPSDVPADLIKALMESQTQMFEVQNHNLQLIDNMLNRQQVFMAQIKKIESIMQTTIWSRGMMSNQLFTKYVQSGVNP